MDTKDRIITDLITALEMIQTEARKDDCSRHYILGCVEQRLKMTRRELAAVQLKAAVALEQAEALDAREENLVSLLVADYIKAGGLWFADWWTAAKTVGYDTYEDVNRLIDSKKIQAAIVAQVKAHYLQQSSDLEKLAPVAPIMVVDEGDGK